MTEAEWLACETPDPMLLHLDSHEAHRKRQLFGLGCCRRVSRLLTDDRYREVIADLERGADQPIRVDEADQLISCAQAAADAASAPVSDSEKAAWQAAEAVSMVAHGVPGSAAHFARYASSLSRSGVWDEDRDEAKAQANLLRDIFGNPFHPVALNPAWLTSDVLALARGIYEDRAFDRMPILADALQDAGCDNEDVLNHCRDANQVHVRGCWVVDLVLGKK